MNILILGYGLEGKSVEAYFKSEPTRFEHTKIDVLSSFSKEELLFKDFSDYDLIFRTPSVPPKFISAPAEKITSVTKFFFQNCPCPIIGVTGTKGKGTTCTLIRDLLTSGAFGLFDGCAQATAAISRSREKTRAYSESSEATQKFPEGALKLPTPVTADERDLRLAEDSVAHQPQVYLVGNIGVPALDILPDLEKTDVVVYELSSFQLWDLNQSPEIAVALRIEPDHLDVHESFEEYLTAKENIARHQTSDNSLIYFNHNQNTLALANTSPAQKLPYPLAKKPKILSELLSALKIPGEHNKENAEAALLATYAYSCSLSKKPATLASFSDFLTDFSSELSSALENFQPLPHHIEFVRSLNGVEYYDDSFSTVLPALEAALNAFSDRPLILIAGGKDKGTPIQPVQDRIFHHPHLVKAVLIGETAKKIAWGMDPEKFILAGTDFPGAIKTAQALAEDYLRREEENSDTCIVDKKPKILSPVVLLSPCASSFDMFASYKARGDLFKELVNSLN